MQVIYWVVLLRGKVLGRDILLGNKCSTESPAATEPKTHVFNGTSKERWWHPECPADYSVKLEPTVCINSFFFSFEWNWVRNWPRIPQACWPTRASIDTSFHSDSIPIPYRSGRGRIFLLCLHQQACPSMSFRNNFINYFSMYSIFNTNIKYIWKQSSCITQLLSYITRYSQVQGHSIMVLCPTGGKKACEWNTELGGCTINTNVISLAFEGEYSSWHWCFLMWEMGPSSDLDWRCSWSQN